LKFSPGKLVAFQVNPSTSRKTNLNISTNHLKNFQPVIILFSIFFTWKNVIRRKKVVGSNGALLPSAAHCG